MKIAYVVNGFPIASETFHLQRIADLIARGHEVDIFAHFKKKNAIKMHSLIEQFDLLSHAYWSNMPESKSERMKNILRNFGKYFGKHLKILSTLKFGVYPIVNFSRFYRYLSFSQIEKKYDVIHAGHGTVGLECLPLNLMMKNCSPKFIVSFCGSDVNVYLKKYGKKFYTELFKQADYLLPVSSSLENKLIDANAPREKVIVHRTGLDLDQFKFIRNRKIGEMPLLLSVGRLFPVKGFEYGIKAIRHVLDSGLEVKYVIVGDGPLRSDLDMMVNENGLTDYIHLVGNLSQSELFKYFYEANMLLFTSIIAKDGSQEGLPTVILEALAVGLPVISSRTGGVEEIIQHDESGILVEPKDAPGLAEEIRRLLGETDLRSKLVKNGRKVIEEEYNINKQNIDLINLYES